MRDINNKKLLEESKDRLIALILTRTDATELHNWVHEAWLPFKERSSEQRGTKGLLHYIIKKYFNQKITRERALERCSEISKESITPKPSIRDLIKKMK